LNDAKRQINDEIKQHSATKDKLAETQEKLKKQEEKSDLQELKIKEQEEKFDLQELKIKEQEEKMYQQDLKLQALAEKIHIIEKDKSLPCNKTLFFIQVAIASVRIIGLIKIFHT
jgi:hypothetical protein